MIDIGGSEPWSLPFYLGDRYPAAVSHLVVRATFLPDTVRCSEGNSFRRPLYDDVGGFSPTIEGLWLQCYADVRVNRYVSGSGPAALTVKVDHVPVDPDDTQEFKDEMRTLAERVLSKGGFHPRLRVSVPTSGFEGREFILFLGPSVDAALEAWEMMFFWGVDQRSDGTAIAVHPDRDIWKHYKPDEYQTHRTKLEMELPAFREAVTTAHAARVAANGGRIWPGSQYPMFVSDAGQLGQFFRDTGAYDHPDGLPVQPPPL